MNIIVCIKQVPETTEVKIDPKTNTLAKKTPRTTPLVSSHVGTDTLRIVPFIENPSQTAAYVALAATNESIPQGGFPQIPVPCTKTTPILPNVLYRKTALGLSWVRLSDEK